MISAAIQSIPRSAPSIQIVSQEEAETVIVVATNLKKEIEWKTYKTNNPELVPFGACNSGDDPVARLNIEVSMDIQKNSESIQKVNKTADGYKNMEYGEECYFDLKPGQTEEPDIIPVCQTRQPVTGGTGYRKTSINFDDWFNSLKRSIYPKIIPSITSAFLIMEENVPVTFFKISKPEGVKEAHGYMSDNQWASAKNVYEKLLPSLDYTPDLKPEEKADFYHNYALTLMSEGDFEKALEMLNKAYTIFNKYDYERTKDTLNYLIENQKKLNEQK